jgi:hypothetical protein
MPLCTAERSQEVPRGVSNVVHYEVARAACKAPTSADISVGPDLESKAVVHEVHHEGY